VVAKNRLRHKKTIKPTKDLGQPILLHMSEDPQDEAEYVADVVNILSRRYSPKEVAVFFRTNAQSRPIEEVLIRRNIPYRLVGAHKFFDRKEIRDLLAYLELVVNPDDDIALRRVINVPSRGVGAKTIEKAAQEAKKQGTSLFHALQDMKVSGARGQAIRAFIQMIQDLHEAADKLSVFEMLKEVNQRSGYLEKLRNSRSMEDMARVENIEQLLLDVREYSERQEEPSTFNYLAATSLRKGESVDGEMGINLMTVHAAKGLEFDAVVVVGLVEGMFPHKNSVMDEEKVEEERRLMYVAMTRARERLILSGFHRMITYGSGWTNAKPSRFLRDIPQHLLRVA
jgi:DNA helicase-2/ATP-dependent DNA helicase PcrA